VYLVAEAKRLNSRKRTALVVGIAAPAPYDPLRSRDVAPSPGVHSGKALDAPNGIRTKPVQALVTLAAAFQIP
jgi:hypothetical protein